MVLSSSSPLSFYQEGSEYVEYQSFYELFHMVFGLIQTGSTSIDGWYLDNDFPNGREYSSNRIDIVDISPNND